MKVVNYLTKKEGLVASNEFITVVNGLERISEEAVAAQFTVLP